MQLWQCEESAVPWRHVPSIFIVNCGGVDDLTHTSGVCLTLDVLHFDSPSRSTYLDLRADVVGAVPCAEAGESCSNVVSENPLCKVIQIRDELYHQWQAARDLVSFPRSFVALLTRLKMSFRATAGPVRPIWLVLCLVTTVHSAIEFFISQEFDRCSRGGGSLACGNNTARGSLCGYAADENQLWCCPAGDPCV